MTTILEKYSITNRFGLPDFVLQEIIATIKKYPQVTQAKIFGSRAKGNYKRYSDIDIAIYADTTKSLSSHIKYDLEELYIIYFVDVLHYEHTSNQAIKEHIDRVGVNIL